MKNLRDLHSLVRTSLGVGLLFGSIGVVVAAEPGKISPTASGEFAGGFWSGDITLLQAATNVVLRADDGFGHFGQSLPFDVGSGPVPPVIITVKFSGNQVQLSWPGGILQSGSRAAGPYGDVTNANSPYVVSPSAPRQFFRVRLR